MERETRTSSCLWQNRTSSRTSKNKGTTEVDEIECRILKEEFKEEAEKSEELVESLEEKKLRLETELREK